MLNLDELRTKKLKIIRNLKTNSEWNGKKENLLLSLMEQVLQVAPDEEISEIFTRAQMIDVDYFREKMSLDVALSRHGIEEELDLVERSLLKILTQWRANPELSQQWVDWVSNPQLQEKLEIILRMN